MAPAKEKGNVCSACFYVARGSFKEVRQQDLRDALDQHPPVKQKRPGRAPAFLLDVPGLVGSVSGIGIGMRHVH